MKWDSQTAMPDRYLAQGAAQNVRMANPFWEIYPASTSIGSSNTVEPAAGERFDIDWGHFGALPYNGAPRKLYAFCLVECHSRKMYLEFTHSQSFETFARCHLHGFQQFGGSARELWYDNLATAVAEHEGNLVRFNPRFLAFAREFGFIPRACHVAAAWEKGRGMLRQQGRQALAHLD
jgi:hypothetical protein